MKEVQYVCRRLSLTLNEGVPYMKHDIYNMTSPSIECLMYHYLILQVAREVLHALVEVEEWWGSVCSVGVGRLHSGAGPISPVCPRPPPTCYLIVTTIHSTSPISGFKLMNVGTFLWYTEHRPTQSFHLFCNFYITYKLAVVAKPEILSSAVLNVLWQPK